MGCMGAPARSPGQPLRGGPRHAPGGVVPPQALGVPSGTAGGGCRPAGARPPTWLPHLSLSGRISHTGALIAANRSTITAGSRIS